MVLSKKDIKACLLLILYRIILDAVYKLILAKSYLYQGFVADQTILNTFFSWLLFALGCVIFLAIERKRAYQFSKICIIVLFLISFVPFTTMVQFGAVDSSFIIGNAIYWIILLALQAGKTANRFLISYRLYSRRALSNRAVYIIGALSALVVIYVSWKYTHFRFHFNLMTVYALRAEARTFQMGTIMTYLFSWTRTVNSLMIGYSLLKKNRIATALFAAVQLLSFGIDGMKTTIFLPLIVVALFLARRFLNDKNFTIVLMSGICAVCAVAILQVLLFKKITIGFLFNYRTMFLPIKIGSYYWDFFTHNVPDYFRSSFLRHFGLVSPYSGEGIQFMISRLYFHDPAGAANSGLIADAVTNFGKIGTVIMPFIITLVWTIIDKCSKKADEMIVISAAVIFSITMINNFITISLLTQGGIALAVLLLFMKREDHPNRELKNNEFCCWEAL